MSNKPKSSSESVEQTLSKNYVPKANVPIMPVSTEINEAIKKKDAEKTKADIDKFAEALKKKYKFLEAIGVAPAQSNKLIEDEYEIPEVDAKKNLIHLVVVIPEKKFKEIQKMKAEVIKMSKDINDKFWVHLFTPVDFWNFGLDSKFSVFEAFSMSYPLHDPNTFLGNLRISHVHKSLVLRKFEKYVTSYVMGGSFVRGETTKTSDIDVIIIIDDTDVKRMSRYELLEKLRGIIHSHIAEATAIAQVKVDFNVQVWLLTDFWERVKDAEPVAFTFIRDGIPFYDRGAFLPWKSLLRMGRIKPSPESIDMFMVSGEKMKDQVSKKIFDILIHDIYWGTIHPTQAMLMLFGLSPQNVYDTAKSFRETFVDKEKLIEPKYADIFEEIAIKYYKGFEHGKVKAGDVSGADIDRLYKDALDYIERLKALRSQIENRIKEKDIEEIHTSLFKLLETILNKKGEAALIAEFDTDLVKTGKFTNRDLKNLKFISQTRKAVEIEKKKAKKSSSKKDEKDEKGAKLRRGVDDARKKALQLTNALNEYAQRSDFLSMDRSRFIIKGEKLTAEIFFLKDSFVVHGNKIQKIEKNKLVDANPQELETQLIDQKKREHKIDFSALEVLKKEFGEFELTY
ncbi:MAG: putative nucleotidyltransferase [Patescibacteria group bacterium]|jgi:predicted nucleotidyltransferase